MGIRGFGLVLLAALALMVSGCGGGGSGTSTSDQGAALSRAAFINEAETLCKRSKRIREARFQTANGWVESGKGLTRPLREKIIRFMVVAPAEDLSRELAELGKVRDGNQRLNGFAKVLEEDARKAQAKPLTVAAGIAFAPTAELARDVGLPDCTI